MGLTYITGVGQESQARKGAGAGWEWECQLRNGMGAGVRSIFNVGVGWERD